MNTNKSKFTQTNLKEDKLKILQTYFPESILMREDGNGNKSYEINALKLQSFFNNGESVLVNTLDAPKDGYELSWVGKKFAYQDTFQIGEKVLKLEKNQSKNIDSTENIVLIGDNIEALKLLRQNYHNSIKCIYIDPPYNTGNDDFTYADRFKETGDEICEQLGYDDKYKDLVKNMYSASTHSAWMSFMLSRVLLAKELLKDDGVIFISIDDNEQAQLKLLCDEVFGESNFVALLPTIMNLKGNQDQYGFAGTHEYMFCYAYDVSKMIFNKLPIDEENVNEKWLEDEIGLYKKGANLKATGTNAPREKRPNLFYPIYITNNTVSLTFDNNSIELLPITHNQEMSWRWSREKFSNSLNDIIISKNGEEYSLYKKQRPDLGDLPSSKQKSIFYKPVYSSGNGTNQVKKLFNEKIFAYPKPVELIKDLITIGTNKDDIILDFFAGSGTTGDAVMQLNAEDGGNRKFILVQLDASIDPKNSEVAHKFCIDNNLSPVISSITIERLNRAGDKILEKNLSEKPELKDSLDIGYKVFSIHDDPESKFLNSDISEYKQEELFSEYSKIKNDPEFYTKENLIYNAYIYNNIPLSVHYKELKKDVLYQAENHYFCFGEISRDELDKHLNEHTEGAFTVFCGDGYVTDSLSHTCEAHLMQIAPNITYKVHG